MDNSDFGVSFSIKQCRNFGIDSAQTLAWLLDEAGFRRFRLMSYWNEHEKTQGSYDFTELDAQVAAISKHGGTITLCLGVRQPRWPENHWPEWAWKLPKDERSAALLAYMSAVVERYKKEPAVISYQLENEALLEAFGERPEIDRQRLRQEYELVKRLDPSRPIIMTTSTSWGIPVRKPIPDSVGISFYQIIYRDGAYHRSFHVPIVDRFRKVLVRLMHRKPLFVHELQLEPWGPTAIWKMSLTEQDASMSPQQIARNVQLARKIGAKPIDLWGGEWWYWRLTKHNDPSIWQAVKQATS